jgi:ubiquinone/menaquinone biosynthesis C-methylase UbiE/DNA-binding transcriptional ArsR family regulator
MEELLAGLRGIAETTRLRIVFVLSHGEFNVSELTQILGQSQPRISRHLKLMAESGLLTRHKEGSWVLFRLRDEGAGGALARTIAELLPAGDSTLSADAARLEEVRQARAERASAFFRANAGNWETLRSLHIREEEVEAAMQRLVGRGALGTHLDLGTGTGRILKLFAPQTAQGIGVDSSREMLAIARASIEDARMRHLQMRHGDIFALPFPNDYADFVSIHQVLHYLDEPGRALAEAARVLKPGGRLLIVDFAPHELEQLREEQAHRRLGIAGEQMIGWLRRAGLELVSQEVLPPPWRIGEEGLTVSIWLARALGEASGRAPAKTAAENEQR